MCTEISFANPGADGAIESVGGWSGAWPGGADQQWRLDTQQVIALIETGRWAFFVERPTGTPPDRVPVRVVTRDGKKFLRTEPDRDVENNLTALPRQDTSFPAEPPAFPVSLPPAQEPRLVEVYDRAGKFLATPGPSGLFGVLPRRDVLVRFRAPFSSRYEVRVNGGYPLRETAASTRPANPDTWKDGWFSLQSMGYFAFTNPGGTSPIFDRDDMPYELYVGLPERVGSDGLPVNVGDDPFVSVLIAQVSLNSRCIPPTDKSSSLQVPLGKRTPTPSDPPAPSEPISGVENIRGWYAYKPMDQFSFKTRVVNPALNGARITTVLNRTTTKDGKLEADLVNVVLTDEEGATATADIPRGTATSAFAGRLIKGDWSLRVTNLSALLLDSRRIELEVAWNRP